MVKRLLFIALLLSSSLANSQSFELGLGAQGNINWLKGNESFLTATLDKAPYFDTVYFNFNETKMDISYSIPIFFRFRTNFGFWAELSYATEKMTANISGRSNYSDAYLEQYATYNMQDDYQTGATTGLTWEEFYAAYHDLYFNKESESWEEQVAYKEVTKFNNLSVNFGYTFLRTKKIRPFLSLGFSWNSRSNINHYQELHYETEWVNDYSNIYRKLPRLNSNIFFITAGAGIEVYNMQLGVNLRQSVGSVQEFEFKDEIDFEDESFLDLYKNITSFSFYMKYSLFNFNVRNADDRQKLKNEELKVLGDFKEKSKLVRFGIGINIPFYTNLNSLYDKTYPRDTVFQSTETPSMIIDSKMFISNYRVEVDVNTFGVLDTIDLVTHIALGRIKRISQFPRINFTMEIEPLKYFSYQTDIGYQFSEFDTEAKIYIDDYDWANDLSDETMKSSVLRQSFHTITLGQKFNVKYDVSPEVFIGLNGGVNFNFMIPGKFKFENPGYNSDEIFKEFDEYYVRGNNDENWNTIGTGVFYNDYEFWQFDDDYNAVAISEEENMSTFSGRFWMSWTAGLDFYYGRLKVSPFVEGKITDINILYQDFLTIGMGFTYYIRK